MARSLERLAFFAGQVAGQITRREPAADIVAAMVREGDRHSRPAGKAQSQWLIVCHPINMRPKESSRMAQRINYARLAPSGIAALEALQFHVDGSGLDHALLELVKTRASQLNACAYCIDITPRMPAPPARASSVSTG